MRLLLRSPFLPTVCPGMLTHKVSEVGSCVSPIRLEVLRAPESSRASWELLEGRGWRGTVDDGKGRGPAGDPLFSDAGELDVSHWTLFSVLLGFRIRRVWQKRKCGVKYGCLTISHSMVRPLPGSEQTDAKLSF